MAVLKWLRCALVCMVVWSVVGEEMLCGDACLCIERDAFCESKWLDLVKWNVEVSYLYIKESNVSPVFLGRLEPNLLTLHIVDSRLDSVKGMEIPALHKLTLFEIVRSCLEYLPRDIFKKYNQLKHVDLSENKIGNVSSVLFAPLPLLEKIDISHNKLQQIKSKTFSMNRKVRKLDLSYNEIRILEAGAFNISEVERGRYVFLNISDNALTEISEDAFAWCWDVTELHLSRNRLQLLRPGAFAGLGGLHLLRLNDNSLRALPDGVFRPLRALRELDLSDNLLTSLGDAFATVDLPALQVLHVVHNNLRQLPRGALGGAPSLQALDLQRNALSRLENGSFAPNAALQALNLQHNLLRELPCAVFYNASAMQTLLLDGNDLQRLGLAAFSPLRSLQTLSLQLDQDARCEHAVFNALRRRGVQLQVEKSGMSESCRDAWSYNGTWAEQSGEDACDWDPNAVDTTTQQASSAQWVTTPTASLDAPSASADLTVSNEGKTQDRMNTGAIVMYAVCGAIGFVVAMLLLGGIWGGIVLVKKRRRSRREQPL